MRRLVILGCGYIGTELARAARVDGAAVSVLVRDPSRAAILREQGFAPVAVADLASDAWHRELDPGDASVVMCVSPSTPNPAGYRHSFIAGTQSLARWLEKSAAAGHAPARDVLFTSATGVYPQTDGSWVDEDTPVDPATLSPAGALLREAEELFFALPKRLAERIWVLRFAGLYGPQRHHLLDALRIGQRTFPGGGDHWVNLLHRDDAVAAIRACFAAPAAVSGGIFNAVDNEPVLKRDLLGWLMGELGQNPAALQFDPTASARSPHRENATGVAPHRRIANQRLREILHWSLHYPSFREGYRPILRN
jgi:nucleoside-diphosphate-sugar epimerase